MQQNTGIIKSNFVYTITPKQFTIEENSYLIYENGKIIAITKSLSEQYKNYPLYDYTNNIIFPGFIDMHLHAPQYAFRGLGMDMELLPWLETYTFPEEAKYQNKDYAKKAYSRFTEDLLKSPTTRAVIFATIHKDATALLMDMIEKSGLCAYIGKVNMDLNCPDYIKEQTQNSLEETEAWIQEALYRYQNVSPIITPRFVPTCSEKLMKGLGELAQKYHLPIQSHLSENRNEIAWVQSLFPDSKFYGEVYDKYGLFGNPSPTVMAHCVSGTQEELELMKQNGVFVAHCPSSNINLASGIAPVKKLLGMGISVGLGTDIAGGHSLSMFDALTDAIRVSKLWWSLADKSYPWLSPCEAFYAGTKAGGSFFGKTGSFEKGFELDALVLDDSKLLNDNSLSIAQRTERILYLANSDTIVSKFVKGVKLF